MKTSEVMRLFDANTDGRVEVIYLYGSISRMMAIYRTVCLVEDEFGYERMN